MNRVKKIKAFTLSEMIVVLLITTIVVGMAFVVLNLVQKQMHGIQGNYEINTRLNLLRQSLWTDFNRFENIRYNAEQSTLVLSNELGHSTYIFEEDLIIKEQDTFEIKREYLKFYFEKREQSSGIIDAIDLRTTKEFGDQEIFVFKRNSANIYLKFISMGFKLEHTATVKEQRSSQDWLSQNLQKEVRLFGKLFGQQA